MKSDMLGLASKASRSRRQGEVSIPRVDHAQNLVHESYVEFEWDPHKSALNEEKHGIGFSDARSLWSDPGLVLLPS